MSESVRTLLYYYRFKNHENALKETHSKKKKHNRIRFCGNNRRKAK